MTNKNKTTQNNLSVSEFISTVEDNQTINDCKALINLMEKVSGCKAKMWGTSIIGFDSYHYKYESGREGDSCVIGFSPRKGKTTIYLVDGTARYTELLAKLGKHSTGKVCVYIKNISDIDIDVLEKLIKQSYEYTKSQDGNMHRA